MLPPKPCNEAERLAALRRYRILDTAPEAAFDDITRLIADICAAPIAVINFIEEGRQWFKSEIGLGFREFPLDLSICAHALLEPGLTIISDLQHDPRFACNPLVTGDPHLRFYAGALLESGEFALGTLCVLDTVPRELTDVQKDALALLARQVVSQLEFRRALHDAEMQAEARAAAEEEHKRGEEALRSSEERARLALKVARLGTWRYDPATNFVGFDERMREIWGEPQSRATLTLEEAIQRIHPDDRDRVTAAVAAALDPQSQGKYKIDYRLLWPDGTTRWVAVMGQARFEGGDERHAVEFAGTGFDITDRKQAEARLRESEQRFRTLADNIAQFVWIADDKGWIFWYSKRWYDYTGTTLKQMQGWGWRKVHHPEHVDRVVEKISHCFRTGEIWEDTFPLRGEDGGYRWFLSRALPIKNDRSEVQFWFGTNTDITELREAQEALREREQRLAREREGAQRLAGELADLNLTLEARVVERTSQLRALVSELVQTEQRERRALSQLLHDQLQQTLVASKMRLRRLLGDDSPEARDARKATELLDEAIRTSRSLAVELSPPALFHPGLRPALEWLAGRALERYQINCEIELAGDDREIGDDVKTLLVQAVQELLLNAAKHAAVGRVKIKLDGTSPAHVKVSVKDDGAGFDSTTLERKDHRGFGLFNIRERCEWMNGDLRIESAPDQGTSVTLTLPLAAAPALAEEPRSKPLRVVALQVPAPASRSSPVIRVLLVDDHRIVRDGIKGFIKQEQDIEVAGEAADGEEAIQLARKIRPDVIVMDINMPRLNGIQATRTITDEMPWIKIIGLSMDDQDATVAAMRAAGASAYIGKDKAAEALCDAIREQFAGAAVS